MKLIVGVKKFGKISNAEVALADLVMFVGNNNSGKTMMMQLIYGVIDYISARTMIRDIKVKQNDDLSILFDKDNFMEWEKEINESLSNDKDKIISQIFHKIIKIDDLYVRFEDISGRYVAKSQEKMSEKLDIIGDGEVSLSQQVLISYDVSYESENKRENVGRINFVESFPQDYIVPYTVQYIKGIILDQVSPANKQIYFPASRTGIQLLYKYFFAERDKQLMEVIEIKNTDVIRENVYGLTNPIYDYLQFLQKHTKDIDMEEKNKELLQFIEEKMIDGKIMQEVEETFYQDYHSKEKVPMYLASALVNEMTPVIKTLTSNNNFIRYYWDEVETCIHPLKQGELARFIVRMVNSGRKMVISTHSDTMACKLNNLFILSFLQNKNEQNDKLQKLGLSKDDLLKNDSVKVYQFVNLSDGSSEVKELEFKHNPKFGYDFHLFMKNLDELYRETEIIME